MLETLLNKLEALVNEHGSAAVLREHLALVRERVQTLERENGALRLEAQQAQAQFQKHQDRVHQFAQRNPDGWRRHGRGG